MAGPIQTAIGSLINTSAGALAIGKKISDDERQAGEKAAKEAKAAKAEADAEAKAAAEEEAKAKKQKQLSSAALKEEKKALNTPTIFHKICDFIIFLLHFG